MTGALSAFKALELLVTGQYCSPLKFTLAAEDLRCVEAVDPSISVIPSKYSAPFRTRAPTAKVDSVQKAIQ